MSTDYYIVTLAVPRNRQTEDHPSEWDWQSLLDSVLPCITLSVIPTALTVDQVYRGVLGTEPCGKEGKTA